MKTMNTMKKNIVTFIICIIVLITLFVGSVSAGYSSFCWSPFVEKTIAGKNTVSVLPNYSQNACVANSWEETHS